MEVSYSALALVELSAKELSRMSERIWRYGGKHLITLVGSLWQKAEELCWFHRFSQLLWGCWSWPAVRQCPAAPSGSLTSRRKRSPSWWWWGRSQRSPAQQLGVARLVRSVYFARELDDGRHGCRAWMMYVDHVLNVLGLILKNSRCVYQSVW